MGSSLGGLVSLYAGIEHQDVFSKVGAFSPSFWFSDEAYEQVLTKGKQANMRIYLIAGGQESDQIKNGTKKMYGILQQAGFDDSELFIKIHSSGSHNEAYWGREFPAAYQWLFDNNIVSTSFFASKSNVKFFPNPFAEFVNFSHTHDLKNVSLNIYNGIGELLYSTPLAKDGQINMSHLKNGFYFFQLTQNGETVLTKKLLHLE